MREIKFRVWNSQINEMLFHRLGENHWYTKENKAVIFTHNDHHETALKTRLSEPMQFTGLHDENGTEIYEGDIVKALGNVVCWCPDCKKGAHPDTSIGKIEIKDGMTKISYKEKSYMEDTWYDFNKNKEYQIIGNIYANPEIFEVTP